MSGETRKRPEEQFTGGGKDGSSELFVWGEGARESGGAYDWEWVYGFHREKRCAGEKGCGSKHTGLLGGEDSEGCGRGGRYGYSGELSVHKKLVGGTVGGGRGEVDGIGAAICGSKSTDFL